MLGVAARTIRESSDSQLTGIFLAARLAAGLTVACHPNVMFLPSAITYLLPLATL